MEFCLRSAGWSTTTDKDDAHEQKDDNCRKLQNGYPELFFGISHDTKQADDADSDEEYNDPDCDVYFSSPAPPLDCETSDDEFEWKHDSLGYVSVGSRLQFDFVLLPIERRNSSPLRSPRMDR
jgi:hypothetical protein